MRRLITLLLVVTLTWVTTSYACRMDGWATARAVCCCPGHHSSAKHSESGTAQVAKPTPACCDVISGAAIDQNQPAIAAQVHSLDLPVVAGVPPATWMPIVVAQRLVRSLSPARGPPLSGTRTYLATSRLRL